jgi:hypothetical protein
LRQDAFVMGSFFTNIHIRCGQNSSLETIEATLDKVAKKSGLARSAENATKIDRTIIIRSGDGPWISLYDESTEDQDSNKLEALGKALSESTQSSVVSVLVHQGPETRYRNWSRRYLRAVGNDTSWLGAELRKHLFSVAIVNEIVD